MDVVDEAAQLEPYPVADRQPMQLDQGRRDVLGAFFIIFQNSNGVAIQASLSNDVLQYTSGCGCLVGRTVGLHPCTSDHEDGLSEPTAQPNQINSKRCHVHTLSLRFADKVAGYSVY